ncbi:MAG: hypothetical protein WBD07_02985 [Vicinamibacterales bacterium]
MKALAPQYWEQRGGTRPSSVFWTAADRHYIALRTDVKPVDTNGINAYQSAYWSYTALILNQTGTRMPLWLLRGLAGVMSNSIVRPSMIQLGQLIPWHIQRLRNSQRLRLRDLLVVDAQSPWNTDGARLPVLDAECWAFTHYLMFGEDAVHRPKLDRFVQLLNQQRDPQLAATEAFGDIDALEQGFVRYFDRQIFGFLQIKVDVVIKEDTFVTRALPPAEAMMARAAFHVATRRPVEARALIDESRKASPNLAQAYELDGLLADADRNVEGARPAYGKAIELGSTNFYAHFRWAALTLTEGRGRGGPDPETRARVEQALERATSLNAQFAPAQTMLQNVRGGRGPLNPAPR